MSCFSPGRNSTVSPAATTNEGVIVVCAVPSIFTTSITVSLVLSSDCVLRRNAAHW
jgi:hypothetical protein